MVMIIIMMVITMMKMFIALTSQRLANDVISFNFLKVGDEENQDP